MIQKVQTLWGEEEITGVKRCDKCNKIKPLTDYPKREGNKTTNSSYRSSCKECGRVHAEAINTLKKQNPKPKKEDYRCPVCDKVEAELKENNKWGSRDIWCLDHNHNTLEFRGWICNNCNIALGKLNDDPELLQRGITYLKGEKNE